MNIIDIILLAVALWAIYDGVRDGLLVQIGGVVGLVVGAWLAFRYAERVGIWFGMNGAEASVAGFIAVLVVSVIVITLGSRLLRGVFRWTGLGIFDSLFGAALSVLKMAVIASLVIAAIDTLNVNYSLIGREKIENSKAYLPLRNFSTKIFPLFERVKEQVMGLGKSADEALNEVEQSAASAQEEPAVEEPTVANDTPENITEQSAEDDAAESVKSKIEKQIGEKVKEVIIEKIENI